MTPDGAPLPEPSSTAIAWSLATDAAILFAIDPAFVGGVSLRAHTGPTRDQWLAFVTSALRPGLPIRRLPVGVADERLLGGLDLAATLKSGKPVAERGLLADAHHGVIVVASAERLERSTVAHIGQAMDQAHVFVARDGFSFTTPAAFGVIALDEGLAEDERPPDALLDRLAFLIDIDAVAPRDAQVPEDILDQVASARRRLRSVAASDDIITALCQAALAMGIASIRAPILALRAARALAAFDGRDDVNAHDASRAAQLVLAPRATRIPADNDASDPDQPEPPPPSDQEQNVDDANQGDQQQLADIVLEAAKAAIPAGLLAALKTEGGRRSRAKSAGRTGDKQKSLHKGRPTGVRRGELKSGARLNVIETLRAAAPWQPLRRRDTAARLARQGLHDVEHAARRVEVRKDDFRLTRFKKSSETTTIFVVDASGSAALNRLAEAKGAVELLLADCYVRRDSVALIAFRGKIAEVLLPPTRSLARAKRSLAGLPGGGGTPLALGIDAAAALADAARRKGQTPTVIVLTDGRANIARDGTPGRPTAEADGLAAARSLADNGIASLVIDTSPLPAQQSARLADAMGAVYLALPRADAMALKSAVQSTTNEFRAERGAGR